MAFATGLEGFVTLLPWLRRDRKANGVVETKTLRWVQWGDIDRGDYAGPYAWYILIRLPSYLMKLAWYRDGEPTWHQRCLYFKGELPAGKEGWEMIEIECE